MNTAATCSHCWLPIGRLGQAREVNGKTHRFCCYGCCLAYQVHHGEHEEPEAASLLIRLGVGGFLAMNIMVFSLLLYSGTFSAADEWLAGPIHWLLWILATPLLLILGGPFMGGAWRAAQQGQVTTDTLVSIGALAAYGYSAYQVVLGSGTVYFDTATMILVLFTLGRYLEAQGRVRAARSLVPMLAAERAEVRTVIDGKDTTQAVSAVQPGAVVRVLPGERIAVDGIVVEGRSHCDEAILTGQFEVQPKAPGARIHAGSINGAGQLLVRATSAGTNTQWVRISRLVREALARKSLTGDMVDGVAAVFIPFVLLLAAGSLWFWSGRVAFDQALLTALAVLVVACPCSLGLAAPLAITLGIGQAAQRGILIRGGGVLEKLARLKALAFDKTGTLTQGKPELATIVVNDATEREVLWRAAALALASEHPLARAIARERAAWGSAIPVAGEVQAHPGAGITGNIDGEYCAMGSRAFMASLGWTIGQGSMKADAEGNTVVYVGWRGRARGLIALSDPMLPEAAAVISALRARGLETLLLSGDREEAVARVAAALNIAKWRSELMPEGKVQALQQWTQRRGAIAMVGDGLNDGPVLAAASVGIAVGGATDLARESADVTLPLGALKSLPWLLGLAARVRRSILKNLAWALGYNAIALSLAVAGMLQPVIAAGLMAGSSLLVVMRSLRANRYPLVAVVFCVLGLEMITPVHADHARLQQVNRAFEAWPVGDYALTDQYGKTFTTRRVQGRWTFILLGDTHCAERCKAPLSALAGMYQRIGGTKAITTTQVLFVSFDPQGDTPALLQKYLAPFDSRFIGATAPWQTLKRLADDLSMSARLPESPEMVSAGSKSYHGSLLLMGPDGTVRGEFLPPFDVLLLTAEYLKTRARK